MGKGSVLEGVWHWREFKDITDLFASYTEHPYMLRTLPDPESGTLRLDPCLQSLEIWWERYAGNKPAYIICIYSNVITCQVMINDVK